MKITVVHVRVGSQSTRFEIRDQHAAPDEVSRLTSEHIYDMVPKTAQSPNGGHQFMVGVMGGPEGGSIQVSDHTGVLGTGSYFYGDVDVPEVEEA